MRFLMILFRHTNSRKRWSQMKAVVAEVYEGVGAFIGLAAEVVDFMRAFFDKLKAKD